MRVHLYGKPVQAGTQGRPRDRVRRPRRRRRGRRRTPSDARPCVRPHRLAVQVHPHGPVARETCGFRTAAAWSRRGCSPSPSRAPARPAYRAAGRAPHADGLSNWLVGSAVDRRVPVLCGPQAGVRRTRGRPSRVSKTPRRDACPCRAPLRAAGRSAESAWQGRRPGRAGAMISTQMPSSWTLWTTGTPRVDHSAPARPADSSGNEVDALLRRAAAALRSAGEDLSASARLSTNQTPCPSYPPNSPDDDGNPYRTSRRPRPRQPMPATVRPRTRDSSSQPARVTAWSCAWTSARARPAGMTAGDQS